MNSNTKVSLNGLYLYTFSDKEKIELSGDYSMSDIINLMVEKWVFWMECHKCGKSDYCKYTQQHNTIPNKKAEIKCGVAIDFITNYIKITFEKLEDFDKEQKQAYLNSAYHLTDYVQSAEINIGTFINIDYLSGWGKYAPTLYGFTKQTLDYLNKAHKEMKHLEIFSSKKNVIFVEGFSEEIFVKSFSSIEVINYEGKGRIELSKIEFLVKQYQEKGYEVYLQVDKDGKSNNQQVKKIINSGLIKEENIFQFKYDFETALAPKLFYKILKDNNLINDKFEDFKKDVDLQKGVVKYVENKYQITLNKRMIATEASLAIYQLSRTTNLYEDENFTKTEIGKFWNFIMRII